MIRQASAGELDTLLPHTEAALKICGLYQAYGADKRFCRFWKWGQGGYLVSLDGAGMCSTHDEWETVSFRFVAPEDPVKIRIVANALQPEQNVYVDNVMLREVGAEPTAQEEEETVADESVPTIQAANTAPLEGDRKSTRLNSSHAT